MGFIMNIGVKMMLSEPDIGDRVIVCRAALNEHLVKRRGYIKNIHVRATPTPFLYRMFYMVETDFGDFVAVESKQIERVDYEFEYL